MNYIVIVIVNFSIQLSLTVCRCRSHFHSRCDCLYQFHSHCHCHFRCYWYRRYRRFRSIPRPHSAAFQGLIIITEDEILISFPRLLRASLLEKLLPHFGRPVSSFLLTIDPNKSVYIDDSPFLLLMWMLVNPTVHYPQSVGGYYSICLSPLICLSKLLHLGNF